MLIDVVQRWNQRRALYRPAREVIVPSQYEVDWILDDRTARAFVELHHYSGSYPAAMDRLGLWWHGWLVGVAVFSMPVNAKTLDVLRDRVTKGDPRFGELGRFVLLDDVPANAESYFLARCFELLRRRGYAGVVSFSDPVPRRTLDDRVVTPGHVGTIYQATNGIYLGRSTRRTLRLLPDGTAIHDRALQKVRARERGWQSVARRLEQLGAEALGTMTPALWLRKWLPRLTRSVRHAGNHKYVWAFDRALRRRLPASLPFPKLRLRSRGTQGEQLVLFEAAA